MSFDINKWDLLRNEVKDLIHASEGKPEERAYRDVAMIMLSLDTFEAEIAEEMGNQHE